MNIVDGRLIEHDQIPLILDSLEDRIQKTLQKGRIRPQTVVDACDHLSKSLSDEYIPMLTDMGFDRETARNRLDEVQRLLSREYLTAKLETELGKDFDTVRFYVPLDRKSMVNERVLPLGVLFHIAAGNADGLPALTVIEGLLAGNINLVKLPSAADPVSGPLLLRLMEIEPALAEYIYLFDTSSKDLETMTRLAGLADGVVVWGGDEAVLAVRKLAKPDTKIIEWGHKLSFAYCTPGGMTEDNLTALADHICQTEQLFCSSCQGIYLDTDSMETVDLFCKRFGSILDRSSQKYPQRLAPEIQAEITLKLLNQEIETVFQSARLYRYAGCSLLAKEDHALEIALLYRNCWVKRLPKEKILSVLKPVKNHLQTVGLLCPEDERAKMADIFFKTGVVRVTRPDEMSESYCGLPHDGEYSLRRYTKVVSWD